MRLKNYCRALVLVTLAASTAGATTPDSRPRRSVLLDVPYLSQTQQLCGGAALAMVLRYWGEPNVFAQDFASLVEPAENGIRTSVLTDAVTRRGWQAVPASGEANTSVTWLADEIDKGRPVIALVEVAARTFHYVVVVGVTATEVVYHDPARAPFRIVPVREFEQQWAAANRWTLVVLPAANRTLVSDVRPVVAAEAPASATVDTPCTALVSHSVTLARAGQLEEAERGLLTAQTLCPSGSSAGLELGGVRFLQRRYEEAETLAESALVASPRDETAWELLATSRYLQGDLLGALEAWNQIGRPRTDVVRIEGVERIDHPILVKRTGLAPRAPITASDFARAERRLDELPTIKNVSLNYFPRADGSADVRAALSERSVTPHGAIGWAAVGLNTAFRRELRMPISGLFRQGERLDFRYRWRPNRPRVLLGLDVPAPGWLPGILGIEALWERQTYPPFVQPVREERRTVGASLSDWLTHRVHWAAGGAADQFEGRTYFAAHGQLDTRWFDDHISTLMSVGYWTPTGATSPAGPAGPAGTDEGFASGHAQIAWRSGKGGSPEWLARAGVTVVGQSAPLALWPGAGSGESRGPLLRAHELHSDGIVVSETFGRRLVFAGLEYQHPVYARKAATVALAGFADSARAWRRQFSPDPSPFHVDIGAGLRIAFIGYEEQFRIDFCYGLRDRRRTISAGFVVPWGQ